MKESEILLKSCFKPSTHISSSLRLTARKSNKESGIVDHEKLRFEETLFFLEQLQHHFTYVQVKRFNDIMLKLTELHQYQVKHGSFSNSELLEGKIFNEKCLYWTNPVKM